jgi:hypothetical protein
VEQSGVIPPIGESPQNIHELRRAMLVFLGVQNRVVQVFLAGEMTEDNRLAHTRCRGDVLGLGARESLPRENVDGYIQKLLAAVLPVHARLGGRGCGSR